MSASASDHIYAIELGSNVKVGRSRTPERRLMSHTRDAAKWGARVGRQWISCPIRDARPAELELIRRCTRLAAPAAGREYFALSWDQVLAEAESIDLDQHDAEASARGLIDPDALLAGLRSIDGMRDAAFHDVAWALQDLRRATAAGAGERAAEIYETLMSTRTDWRAAGLMAAILASDLSADDLSALQGGA